MSPVVRRGTNSLAAGPRWLRTIRRRLHPLSENDESQSERESGPQHDRVRDTGEDSVTQPSDRRPKTDPTDTRPVADPSDALPKYLFEGLQKQDIETLQVANRFIDRLLEERERPVQREELPETAEPVSETAAGYVVEEYVKCGKDNCKCASGAEADMHGPYKYRYYRDETGTLQKEYADNE